MNLANASKELSFRELAIQAANAAKLSSFSRAAEVNPDHTAKISGSVAKTYPFLSRFATLCDPTVVKQFAFIMPSFKMAVLSCPFHSQDADNTAVFAGSLGDSMEIICPVTITMQDVRGEVLSICETRAEVDAYQLPTSTANPLEEEAPPRDADEEADEFVIVAAGPDRIGIQLNVATKEPCFVAVPKVFPVTDGEIQFADFSNTESIVNTPVMPDIAPASFAGVWYEALRYGICHLDNYSLQDRDVLFVYDGIEKAEFTTENRNLVSRFTTVVKYLTPEDELYHTVVKNVLAEKEKAMLIYGAKIVEATPPAAVAPAPPVPPLPTATAPGIAIPAVTDSGITALLSGLAQAISDSSSKTLTGTEREKASEAADAKRFYSILFGRVCEVTDEDGSKTPTFIHASIHPLFLPVLTANKNSKATKAMHEAVETMASELSMQDNSYACSSNLFPRMFDQPLTAALRSGQWEYQHTVLNPEGIKTNFGLHHLAPPRTWTATYITRMQGELQLTQQEQVEEDKSRYNAKTTELYHLGCMGTSTDIHEMVGNFYALMSVIIEFDSANPPLIWTEITKYIQILRSSDGKLFVGRHRNIKEVMFNIGQDIQSIIAGFVSEARKTSYKTALKAGTAISSRIFETAQSQANELRSRFTIAIISASAGTYKDTSVVFKLFQPEPTQEEKNKKKREAASDTNHGSPQARNRPFASGGNRQTGSPSSTPNNVTPNGSPQAAVPPGKTVFVHASPAPQRLPHPGAIFPHPTRANQFTILCCRSAFDGRSCTIPTCAFYHFPSQLTQVPRDLKDKLKEWVAGHELVSWHADALNWATQSPVPAFFPNLRLQIPTATFRPIVPACANIVCSKPAPTVRSPSPNVSHLIDQTAQVDLNASSAGSNAPVHANVTAVTSTITEESVPITSEYLQVMTELSVSSAKPPADVPKNLTDTWTTGKLTSKRLDNFAKIVLPSSVQIQLDQPFGKDSPSHYFYSQKCFRHVLLPVLKSGFLSCRATKGLEKASRRARQLQMLRKKYADVNFLPLQGFQADWESTTTIRDDWKSMTSACLLHFNGDVATMVRWIGGPHVNAHLDIPAILSKLRLIVDPDIHADLSRILLLGAPAVCKAFATEANFQAFLAYGNHDSVKKNQEVYESTIIKNSKRGLTLIMDPKLIHFALNAHLSPQGLVDVLHPRRKPRPLSDSSFRPWPGAMAINDWTNKKNEPKLYFASSFMNFCVWQWNLAITYPSHDRHTGDDDVQCAFPRLKYHPQLVAMHSSISNNTLIMNTGLTFGDNTSPSNFEPVARARSKLAQEYWLNEPELVLEKAKKYLPGFQFAPPATEEEKAAFAVAIPDSINIGVVDAKGRRRAPTYDHHVDDNMYGDITELMPLAAAASVIALYDILGYPDGRIPDPISWDKFEKVHGHLRRVVGWDFNTRDLTFSLPDDKRQALTVTLTEWCTKQSCTLVEAAELHGTLADASRANRKGRAMFFGFQNALRRTIQQRYHKVKGYYSRHSKLKYMSEQLPKHLHHRLDSMISREMAALIWKTKTIIPLPASIQFELENLRAILADENRPWSISIGHVVPRDAQFTSLGDACGIGGGAYCDELRYWFDIVWSSHTRRLFDSGQVHINILEFIVVLLQLAAAITRTEQGFHFEGSAIKPLHKLLIRSDNSPSCNWAHKVSAKSERGQLLVSIYADLLDRTQLTIDCTHIAGSDNDLADFLSRPPSDPITHYARCQQIFQKEPKLRSYSFFRPHPDLISCLESRLSTAQWQASPPLPKSLGQFETVDSITSCSVII